MTYPSGDAFSGTWKADKMHGVGLYKYKKTGDIYSGEYADGLKAGKGTYEFGKDSSRLDGVWEAGQFKTGDWQFKDAGSYAGGFDQGQPAGAGAFHFFTAGGVKITQKGEYKAAVSPDPEAEVDADAEPAVRTWHGIPVYAN
ncbi:hypothetical protein M885DRAFT_505543 [Pelagophyceae sp. CCMP2097]|nr:hypothetical protein M885DRAFT_505543 [Pelagophyceae sp. CCMP2097]|mmetsp:Transcript_3371/g.12233  ORF Transcript_3371/g.12233 Transcript_3371/m.12233 type:complete len:142 (+) Transcript_3371:319-744(+)